MYIGPPVAAAYAAKSTLKTRVCEFLYSNKTSLMTEPHVKKLGAFPENAEFGAKMSRFLAHKVLELVLFLDVAKVIFLSFMRWSMDVFRVCCLDYNPCLISTIPSSELLIMILIAVLWHTKGAGTRLFLDVAKLSSSCLVWGVDQLICGFFVESIGFLMSIVMFFWAQRIVYVSFVEFDGLLLKRVAMLLLIWSVIHDFSYGYRF
jgi:hypothetical protein